MPRTRGQTNRRFRHVKISISIPETLFLYLKSQSAQHKTSVSAEIANMVVYAANHDFN